MNQKLVNGKYCAYSCKYYQDGAVLSLCSKFKDQLKYADNGKPQACEKCLKEIENKPVCSIYMNKQEHYMISISSPTFWTREDAEKWAIENGYRIAVVY